MKDIKSLGIDLAKNVFQLHGADAKGKCVMRKQLSRTKLKEFLVNLKPCTIGIEACTGSHYWAREFKKMGHEVKMISPQFVKPFVKSNKNDKNDAEAIVESMNRPEMRFVPIKRIDQQDMQLLHRGRELIVKQLTAQANQMRGCLAEYGMILPKGISHVRKKFTSLLENQEVELSVLSKEILTQFYEQFKKLDEQLGWYDRKIHLLSKQDERCQRLMEIEGIGPITATAAVSAIGDARVFKNGREVAAWLGLVPKQSSSGNKIRLLGISKRGDRYLRTLLIQGAQSVVRVSEGKNDPRSEWIKDKAHRRGSNIAAVALANKNARIIWALLTRNENYQHSKAGMKKYFKHSQNAQVLQVG